MKLFYISVIELNAGYGAEVFLNRGFQNLGHETLTLDYRKYRKDLPQKFLEVSDFDSLLLQRGEYFPLPLIDACNRPCFFYSSELVSRCRDQIHLFQSGYFDHVFVRTPHCKEFITNQGWMKPENITVFLSAFDESTHRPMPETDKDIDVLFVGNSTPRRQSILNEIKKHARLVECQAFGTEMARMFNRAKIVLNIHASEYLDTETRVFEALGSGSFLLSEALSIENPFSPGKHLIQVSTVSEMIEQIHYYLDRDEERKQIAQQGFEEAMRHHTYTARAAQMINVFQQYGKDTKTEQPAIDREKITRTFVSVQETPQEKAPCVEIFDSSEAMNIGIVTTWFERGAAYVSKQIREVLKKKHNVFIFARGGEMTGEGNPVWDDPSVTWAKKSPLPFPTSFDLNEFRQWIRQKNLQAIIFNEQHWWPPVIGCAQLGLKIGSYMDYYTEQTVPMFNAYDFLICNTKRHHSVFEWHPQAVYIPWGTDINLFRPQTYMLVNPNQLNFFHSAGFNPHRKGTDWVLQSFGALQGPAHLTIHAQVRLRTHFPYLAPLINQLERDGRLTILEQMETAPGFYHRGDVYVYPSRLDGIGLTMAEAMACGLPLIVPNNGPMNEFHDEKSGALVNITRLYARHDGYYWPQNMIDLNHLHEIMQNYVNQRGSIEDKKRSARQFAETHLNWFENSKELPELVKKYAVRPIKEKEETIKMIQAFEQRRK